MTNSALFSIHKVYFAPGIAVVTIAVQAINGPFKGKVQDLYTTQDKLQARVAGDAPWGDAEVCAEARELLSVLEADLVERCNHGVLVNEPCATCSVDDTADAPVIEEGTEHG